MRPRLLILNPNTTPAITAMLAHHAAACCADQALIDTATARFGPAYISTEAGLAIAAHAALDTLAAHAAGHGLPDTVLIGCFGDPGLWALREASPTPVTGLAEAAMLAAAAQGTYAIVTAGVAWGPMLRRLAQALALDAPLRCIHTLTATGGELAAEPQRAEALLIEACRAVCRQHPGLGSIIIGGAGLAGLAARIAPAVGVPMIDSVDAGVRHALALAHQRGAMGRGGAAAAQPPSIGLSAELSRWLG